MAKVTGDATYTAQFSSRQKVAKPAAVKGLVFSGKTLTGVKSGAGYTLSGTVKAKDANTYLATAKLKDGCVWDDGTSEAVTVKWSIAKATQTLKAAKTSYAVSYAKVRKASRKLAVKFVASGKGACTWAAAKAARGKVSIAKNGKVTVKKGTPKGTYALKVKVKAAAKGNYRATAGTVVLKIRVK